MAKVTIYDTEGQALLRETVDARECVASGYYSYEPPIIEVFAVGAVETGETGDDKDNLKKNTSKVKQAQEGI